MKTKIKENIHPAEYKGLMTYPLKSFAAVQKVSWNFPFKASVVEIITSASYNPLSK